MLWSTAPQVRRLNSCILLAFMPQAHHPDADDCLRLALITSLPSAIVFWSVPAGTC
ncbi:protein of unknown function (plasmid) [Cupriavidus taiwanensis]|uniref:Uncharacterized protein n=1 Tax=Cupriavidus taiwanensis TaxID=164546 RepID=A0A375ISR4_9BURK|nr:protein of unknown function [Cupriavidus taiwanensis]